MPYSSNSAISFAGIQRSSTLDFPGRLACVLFVRGCNMRCFYCHNAVFACPAGEVSFEDSFGAHSLPTPEVEAFLQKRRGLLDGVVVSGGEPTLYAALPEYLRHLHELGYAVKLDTNGLRPAVVASLLGEGLLDYCAVDWKAPRQELPAVCGIPESGFDSIRETLRLLEASGIGYEARTTLYPGLSGEQLLMLAGELPTLPRYRLNFYHTPEHYRPEDEARIRASALTRPQLQAIEAELRKKQPNLML